ncbi:MAG: hypothetical protein O2910_06840, partial [Proteobacteria bacterium]|nr:hypothetical protein [Pseudomonadota bacterium]
MGRWAKALLLLVAVCSLETPDPTWSQDEAPGYAYKVKFSGLNGTGLEEVLKDYSDLVRLRKESPGSIWELRGRIREDLKTFATILRSEGYYGARLSYDLQRRKQPLDILVEPGERFTVQNFSITFQNQATLPTEINEIADAAATKQIGQPSRNEDIVAAYQSVLEALPDHGYPRVKLVRRNGEADHQGASVAVDAVLDAGPRVAFSKVVFRGLESVREGVVRRQIPWKEGDQFDNREITKFRQALVALNLFASIGIDIDEDLEEGTRQPVIVTLAESEHRTVGVGANYSTSKGFGGEIFWENRNFRGRGEILSVSLKGEERRQSVQADFTK